MAAIVQ